MAKKKITDLKFDDKNFNIGSQQGNALLEKSIQKFGFREAATVDKNGVLIGGNKRTAKAGELGFEDVEIIKADPKKVYALQYDDIDIDTPEGRSLALALNATAKSNIVLDAELVEAELGEAVCEEWGVETSKKLDAEEDDFNGVPPKEPITVLGDLYELNEHRLHCADSCDSDAVAMLMGGQKADITIQSPPYNVGKTPNGNDQKYANDSDDKSDSDYLRLIEETTKNAILNSVFSFINIQSLAGNKFTLIEYLAVLKDWFCDYIIWDKMQAEPAMGENVLNSRFEFVYVFGEGAKRRIGVKKFRGNLENMIFIKSRQDKEFAKVHKATYPVAFAAYFIENFSVQSVLDLFGGTGTSMIASDKLNRKSYLQELDPKYCDVIVARYIKHRKETGSSLVIKRNGQQLSEDEINKYIENTNA